jgi:hypothetical protein
MPDEKTPSSPPFPYLGGKRALRDLLRAHAHAGSGDVQVRTLSIPDHAAWDTGIGAVSTHPAPGPAPAAHDVWACVSLLGLPDLPPGWAEVKVGPGAHLLAGPAGSFCTSSGAPGEAVARVLRVELAASAADALRLARACVSFRPQTHLRVEVEVDALRALVLDPDPADWADEGADLPVVRARPRGGAGVTCVPYGGPPIGRTMTVPAPRPTPPEHDRGCSRSGAREDEGPEPPSFSRVLDAARLIAAGEPAPREYSPRPAAAPDPVPLWPRARFYEAYRAPSRGQAWAALRAAVEEAGAHLRGADADCCARSSRDCLSRAGHPLAGDVRFTWLAWGCARALVEFPATLDLAGAGAARSWRACVRELEAVVG